MAIIRFPRFLGGNEIPEEKQYHELEILKHKAMRERHL